MGWFVPELTAPDEVLEEILTMSTFRLPEGKKPTTNVQSIRTWEFAEKAIDKR